MNKQNMTKWAESEAIINAAIDTCQTADDIDASCRAVLSYQPAIQIAENCIKISIEKITKAVGKDTKMNSLQEIISSTLEVEPFVNSLPEHLLHAMTSIKNYQPIKAKENKIKMDWGMVIKEIDEANRIAVSTTDVDVCGDVAERFEPAFACGIESIANGMKLMAEVFGMWATIQSFQSMIESIINNKDTNEKYSDDLNKALTTIYEYRPEQNK
jgi:late competence protein required for DNA uptake (superfamily II DNA/RNA helicase)